MKKGITFILLILTLSLHAQPPGCSSGTAANGAAGQAGLLGEYFAGYFNDNPAFFPTMLSATNRIESNLNYTTNNWGLIVPPATGTILDPNQFSSRYRGSIYIAVAGTYTFYLTSDDASYMWIDNDALTYPTAVSAAFINNGGGHGDITISNSINLTAGMHNIQILYGEGNGGNHLIFEYQNTSLGIARQVVPNNILCTSIQPALVVPPPPGCVCTDPSLQLGKSGLYGEYYAGYYNDVQSFFTTATPGLIRNDGVLNFNTDNGWGNIAPPATGSSANPELYSARWRGSIYIAVAGTYTFYLTSDDASYLWFDTPASVATPTAASAAINNGGLHSPATVSYTTTFSAGYHQLKIHFGENTGNNRCVLEYSSATITRQVVPQNILCTCMPAGLLPVELLSFDAVENNGQAILQWVTASEKNNDKFIVIRSADGINWLPLGTIPGAGTTNSTNTYQMVDPSPLAGMNYYRLQQVDFDGTTTESEIAAIDMKEMETTVVNVYPNPFTTSLTLKVNTSLAEQTYTVTVTDMMGNQVQVNIHERDEHTLEIGFPEVSKGVYLLNFGNGKVNTTQRIVYSGN